MKKTLTTLCLLAAGSTAVLAQDIDFSVAKALPNYDLPCCSQQQYTPDFGEPVDFLEMLTGAKKKNKDNKKGAPTPQQQQQAMAGMRPGGAGIPAAPAYNDKNAMLKTFNKDGKWYFEINDTILGRDILAVSRFISTPPVAVSTVANSRVLPRLSTLRKTLPTRPSYCVPKTNICGPTPSTTSPRP